MDSIKIILKKIKGPVWVGITALFVIIIVIIFSSRVLYYRTVDLLTENLRQRILTISITAAANIDPKNLDALQVEEDWKKPEWAQVVSRLHKSKYSNDDIVFMYIFRKTAIDPTKMEFVADADSIYPYANIGGDTSIQIDVNRDGKVEPDGPDKLQWPGQPYPEAIDIPEAFEAYYGPLTSQDLYTDEYGTVITGYAPIKDEAGNTVAVLATDVKADDFFTITTQTLRPFLIFIIFLTFIISILIVVVIHSWRKYAKFLEKSNDDKSEFVGFASHQLRSPLTAMKGYASLIIEGDYGPVSDDLKKAAQIIFDSTKTLASVVDDYLNVSRIELGEMKYNFTRFDLKDLVQEVINEHKPNVDAAGLALEFIPGKQSSYDLIADKEKLKQVIANIFDNSVKYTPHGSITVRLERIGDKARIVIKDTGIGISKEVIPKLFGKFKRAANANKTNIRGTGLGLFIAKEIITAHKGRVWVESEGDGKGSEFYIEVNLDNKN